MNYYMYDVANFCMHVYLYTARSFHSVSTVMVTKATIVMTVKL